MTEGNPLAVLSQGILFAKKRKDLFTEKNKLFLPYL